jgi:hypothetical protein
VAFSASPKAYFGTSRPTEQIFEAMCSDSRRALSARVPFFGSASAYIKDDDVTDEMRALSDADRRFRISSSASIPRYGRFFWFTQGKQLKTISRGSEPANAVRDALGLIHYRDGFSATALFFAGHDLSTLRTSRPTFADAATHKRFLAQPGLARHRQQKCWGWTVNLAQVTPSATHCDGLSERVAIRFNGTVHANCTFIFLPLGKTLGSRGNNAQDNDAIYADIIRRGRTTDDLLITLANYGVR